MNDNQINFFSEEIEFQLSNTNAIRDWIKSIIQSHNKIAGDVNYIFCSDKYLHLINLSYLDHDTYTDIITFDNSEEDHLIEGDIYISIERVMENTSKFSQTFEEELNRVIIHGILHLIGFEDNTDEKKKVMRMKEQESLAHLHY